MNLKDEAIARITDECFGKEYLIPFEEYLTSICTTDSIANKILAPGKTLNGAFSAMRVVAQERAVNGCAYIPPEEGFCIIREYYEIDLDEKEETVTEEQGEVIDITSLLDF